MAEIANSVPQHPSPSAGNSTASPAGNTPAAPKGTVPGTPADAKPGDAPAADPKVSPKLQLLIRREKQALERERTAKTKEEQVTAREQALEAREAKIKEFESVKATNPRKALELLGMSYQDLTMVELNDGAPTPDLEVKNLKTQVDGLTKSLSDKEKAQAEDERKRAEQSEQRANEDFRREIAGHIEQNPEKFELIRFEGQQKLVFDIINTHYERTIDKETGVGKIMTIAEAAERVEAHLEKKYNKALELKKFSTRVVPPKLAPKPNTPPGQKPPTRTLNNGMSGTSSAPKTGILTDEQRIQKAIAFAKGLRSAG